MMHRRRRRSGNLRGTPEWMLNLIPGSTRGSDAPIAVSSSTPESTKKALKGKADSKGKLEKELDRGSECCPVIRVKCERRAVKVDVPDVRYVKTFDYAKEKFVRSQVKGTKTVEKKVKLCSVSAGKHQGDLLPPKEAKREADMLRALLKAENCAVRTVGDKLGGKK